MSKQVTAYSAPSAGAPLVPTTIELAPLAADEVEVKISHCGVCASDLHLARGHWGPWSVYPQTCGHEIIGTVVEAGPAVKGVPLGQRVGVGWWREACEACEVCAADCQGACAKSVPTCAGGNKGGFASAIRVKAMYAFPIPDAIKSEDAAPLMCGGITVYAPLAKFTTPSKSVGVVGLGGLGHLAVKFAVARGNAVTVFSGGTKKKELAMGLGATRYVDVSDKEALAAAANTCDFVLVTGAADDVDHSKLVDVCRRLGTICYVAAMAAPISVSPLGQLFKHISVTGYTAGGRNVMREMLAFAAHHKIAPTTQLFPLADVNKALEAIENNTVRFRAVLTM
jgi:alcohol/geraniol dehydrogenase (NADP+)